jgi:hypothetical protein
MSTPPAAVTASDLADAHWFASSYSNGGGNCVEAADLTLTAHHAVAVRDSKNPTGPALLMPTAPFTTFIDTLRTSRFSR